MKKSLLLYAFFFLFFSEATIQSAAQSSGIYESYAILSLNGGANAYYDLQAATGNPDFNGVNLGMFRAGTNQLVLNGGQNKTYKNGGCDITNGVLQYRIYPTAGVPGSFSPLNMSFLCEYPTAGCGSNSGDQVWEVANGNVNILTGLNPGSYTLEVYTSANYQGCGTGTHYSNNGGANYKASFTVYTDFITKWNLATTGSGATQLSFGVATSGTVSYTWQEVSPGSASGSGTFSGSNLTITGLPTGSIIKLNISPANFQRIIIDGGTDRKRLIDVEQWGSITWISMERAFYGCSNLNITAADIPNFSGVTDLSYMFHSCSSLNGPSNIGSWNTAAVTNMSQMFYQATAFNQPLGNWNTSSVTNMSLMFASATNFNQPIGNWNISAVTDISNMFSEAHAFNQPIGNWNPERVINMSYMFYNASAFNQPIGNWNTMAVDYMNYMFYGATAFNQPLDNWNTSGVIYMYNMFLGATSFNQPLGGWNTSSVSRLDGMFSQATAFNQNLGTWTLNSNVYMANMFDISGMNCANYSATLIGWSKNPSTPSNRNLGVSDRQYNYTGLAARNYLVTTKGWTITDAGNAATSILGATAGGSQVCQNTDISVGKLFTDGCNSLFMVMPSGASPVTGTINACVKIDNAVQFYNGEAYLQRHFDITPVSNPTTATARITLYALQSEFDAFNIASSPYFSDLPTGPNDAAGKAALRITKFSGNGSAPGNYTPGTLTLINPDDADIVWNGYHWEISFNTTGFSGFYIHAPRHDFPLPVTLLNFSGYKDGSRNQLSWTTASEINNRGFDVQRSTDGLNYTSIGFVNSLATGGNSNDKLSYRFTDNTPAGVKQYYRLRQQDINGVSRLSNVIVIKGEKATALAIDGLYPNPVSSQLNVAVSSPVRGTVTLQVVDMTGRILSQQVKAIAEGSNTVSVNVASLSNGSYILKVVNAETSAVSAKFSKQ